MKNISGNRTWCIYKIEGDCFTEVLDFINERIVEMRFFEGGPILKASETNQTDIWIGSYQKYSFKRKCFESLFINLVNSRELTMIIIYGDFVKSFEKKLIPFIEALTKNIKSNNQ